MQVQVHNAQPLTVEDSIFSRAYNETLIHQLVISHQAAARQGTHQQKTRSMVRGGGRKPWRQKGTGRARAGTSRGPIWRSGGVTFARVPRDYSVKLNRKMRRAAMQSILSQLLRQERLTVVEDSLMLLPEPKVKAFRVALGELVGDKLCLLVTDTLNTNLLLGTRNLPQIRVEEVTNLSPVSLVRAETVIICKSALEQLVQALTLMPSSAPSKLVENG